MPSSVSRATNDRNPESESGEDELNHKKGNEKTLRHRQCAERYIDKPSYARVVKEGVSNLRESRTIADDG